MSQYHKPCADGKTEYWVIWGTSSFKSWKHSALLYKASLFGFIVCWVADIIYSVTISSISHLTEKLSCFCLEFETTNQILCWIDKNNHFREDPKAANCCTSAE